MKIAAKCSEDGREDVKIGTKRVRKIVEKRDPKAVNKMANILIAIEKRISLMVEKITTKVGAKKVQKTVDDTEEGFKNGQDMVSSDKICFPRGFLGRLRRGFQIAVEKITLSLMKTKRMVPTSSRKQ